MNEAKRHAIAAGHVFDGWTSTKMQPSWLKARLSSAWFRSRSYH